MNSRLFVFCLTSSGEDLFARMQMIAAQTTRLHVPDAKLVLLVDTISLKCLEKIGSKLLDFFDKVQEVKTPNGPAVWRNRWIKTCMREVVEGDFLYLDADVVVRGDLGAFWEAHGDIVGVQNGNVPAPFFSAYERKRYQHLAWDLPHHGSLNGGVLFWRDTSAARRLCKRYRERWLESCQSTGRHGDQQALNRAIDDEKIDVGFLPPRFNAMETYNPKTMKSAHVWHFINSAAYLRKASNRWDAIVICGMRAPPPEQWKVWPHPWLVRDPIAWIALQSMMRSSKVNFDGDWRRLWLLRHRRSAVVKIVKDTLIAIFGERARGLRKYRLQMPKKNMVLMSDAASSSRHRRPQIVSRK